MFSLYFSSPAVITLCEFLNSLGAKIDGIGSHVLQIEGVTALRGGEGKIIPDYLEAGTFAIAAAASGGEMLIKEFVAGDNDALLNTFSRMGINYQSFDGDRLLVKPTRNIKAASGIDLLKHGSGSITILPHEIKNKALKVTGLRDIHRRA